MKGSIFISGGNKEKRHIIIEEYKSTAHPTETQEIKVLEDKKSIGIEQVREGIKFLQKKPITGNIKLLVIDEAEKLTIEAQNAFLKVLEEPPEYATIVLSAKTHDSLLPTVISRCQKVFTDVEKGGGVESGGGESLKNIRKMSLDEKMEWAQETAKEEKEDILTILENWIQEERESFSENPAAAKNIQKILDIKSDLESTNVNTRLALETLLINIL